MTLSIAMCTYNGEKFLHDQLNSIAAQTKSPDELVICDDQSSDRTVEIIRNFADNAAFPVYLYINEQNLGSTKNFEKAVSLCKSDLIALADQDDYWKNDKLERILKVFDETPKAGYVFSNADLIDKDSSSLGRTLWEAVKFNKDLFSQFIERPQINFLINHKVVTGATMAFRSSLKGLIIPFSKSCIHDSWIAILASATGNYGVPISETLINYRIHSGQQIGIRRENLIEKIKRHSSVNINAMMLDTLIFQELSERIISYDIISSKQKELIVELCQQKNRHFSNRTLIHSKQGFAKLKLIIEEIKSGNYKRFSNSWKSVIKDLLFK
jgi:glycosyltransferase involved in cell wall biosynthesis